MPHPPQQKIAATYMRGGTSKCVFFRLQNLPASAQQPGPARDALLLRVTGSPAPYGKQIDGMGAATSSTSKTVIVSKSGKPGHDVDYLFADSWGAPVRFHDQGSCRLHHKASRVPQSRRRLHCSVCIDGIC